MLGACLFEGISFFRSVPIRVTPEFDCQHKSKDDEMPTHDDFLRGLTPDSIVNDPFPLAAVVDGSLYYPASGTDGSPLRHWPLNIRTFVYVDWSVDITNFTATLQNHPPLGYHLLGKRLVSQSELVPNPGRLQPPPGIDESRYLNAMRMAGATPANSFACWCVFERDEDRDGTHGPDRFSLLHLRAEGLATYHALYAGNNFRPGALAILRPGVGFGGGFARFEETMRDLMRDKNGLPPWLLSWHAVGEGQNPDPPWDECYAVRSQGPFPKDGEVGHWEFSIYPLRDAAGGESADDAGR